MSGEMASSRRVLPIALVDWDGTLRPGFTVLDWAGFLQRRGVLRPEVPALLNDLMGKYGKGRMTHDQLAVETADVLGAGLAGKSRRRIYKLALEFAEEDRHRLRPFVAPLMDLLADAGLEVVIVSGAPQAALLPYVKALHLARLKALRYAGHKRYTGRVLENPGTATEKRRIAEELAGQTEVALAIGDSPSDLPLFEAARVKVIVGDGRGLDLPLSILQVAGELADIERIAEALRGVTYELA